jgi:hypothetical protein
MKTSGGLLARYEREIQGVLGCFDRLVVTGTLTEIAHPEAMDMFLHHQGFRAFDIGLFADPLRQRIRDNAVELARKAGIEIEYLSRSKGVRKEDLVAKVLARRGHHPGLVHVLSVVETCTTFKPWRNPKSGQPGLRMTTGKCSTYYFYLIDPQLGLMYVRVPTWLPCRLQIYFNVHHWLASQLRREGIGFKMEDNCFVEIADWERAQKLAQSFSVAQWQSKFQRLAAQFCPVVEKFSRGYHWSVMQVEYSLDLVFKSAPQLSLLYQQLSRQAMLVVRVPEMARFWGKRYSPEAEALSDFKTIVEGTRVRHQLGRQSIKMYDKGGRVLRIEATSNDITFFRHYRKVVSRDGRAEYKMAALKKSIYSLSDVVEHLAAACRRYLEFIGTLEDDTSQRHDINRISRTVRDRNDRTWRGFNLFLKEDQSVLLALLRGEFSIHGLSNKGLQTVLAPKSSGQINRILRRLRNHGLLKKIAHSYRYYLSATGRRLITAAAKLFEYIVIPHLKPQPV